MGQTTQRSACAARAWQRVFFGVTALVFAVCAALTVIWCTSMSSMGEVPMPGGWSLSMTWAPMCGQKWPRAALSFLGMWMVMMAAMMLPSLAPVLWRYHEAVGRTGEARAVRLTALAGMGYFFVWTVVGVAVFALGAALTALALRMPTLARAVPVAADVVVLAAGVLQFSAWKARHLACCRMRSAHGATLRTGARTAWLHGLRHGIHCGYCCAGLTAVLLVNGVMDLCTMALVTAAITAERFAPAGNRVARATGWIVVVTGLAMSARTLSFG
jgi:predicted metal-binding membrane protein